MRRICDLRSIDHVGVDDGAGCRWIYTREEYEQICADTPRLTIPSSSSEFAINASNLRLWQPPVRRYIEECLAGVDGNRGIDFNMRWMASMVGEVHRILMRGGVFLYPEDKRNAKMGGRLRLMYEASPMSFIVEQAGGECSTGHERIMELQPQKLHQRIPVILGSRSEVARLVQYHQEHHLAD